MLFGPARRLANFSWLFVPGSPWAAIHPACVPRDDRCRAHGHPRLRGPRKSWSGKLSYLLTLHVTATAPGSCSSWAAIHPVCVLRDARCRAQGNRVPGRAGYARDYLLPSIPQTHGHLPLPGSSWVALRSDPPPPQFSLALALLGQRFTRSAFFGTPDAALKETESQDTLGRRMMVLRGCWLPHTHTFLFSRCRCPSVQLGPLRSPLRYNGKLK